MEINHEGVARIYREALDDIAYSGTSMPVALCGMTEEGWYRHLIWDLQSRARRALDRAAVTKGHDDEEA